MQLHSGRLLRRIASPILLSEHSTVHGYSVYLTTPLVSSLSPNLFVCQIICIRLSPSPVYVFFLSPLWLFASVLLCLSPWSLACPLHHSHAWPLSLHYLTHPSSIQPYNSSSYLSVRLTRSTFVIQPLSSNIGFPSSSVHSQSSDRIVGLTLRLFYKTDRLLLRTTSWKHHDELGHR